MYCQYLIHFHVLRVSFAFSYSWTHKNPRSSYHYFKFEMSTILRREYVDNSWVIRSSTAPNRPRKKVSRRIYGHDPGCPFRSKYIDGTRSPRSVRRIKSPFALRTTVGNVTRSRYTVPSSQNIYFDPFPRHHSLSFLSFSFSPSMYPLVSLTRSPFRKTQPPRKTILSHNLRLF